MTTIQAKPGSTARRVASSSVMIASTASAAIAGENGSTYSMRSDTAAAFHHTQACGAAAAADQSQSAMVGRSFGEDTARAGHNKNIGGTKASRWKARMATGSGKPAPPNQRWTALASASQEPGHSRKLRRASAQQPSSERIRRSGCGPSR